jgi:hypothetical protein
VVIKKTLKVEKCIFVNKLTIAMLIYLLHDTRLSLGEGDVSSALVLNVFNLDLATSSTLAGGLIIIVIVVFIPVALHLLEFLVNVFIISSLLVATTAGSTRELGNVGLAVFVDSLGAHISFGLGGALIRAVFFVCTLSDL